MRELQGVWDIEQVEKLVVGRMRNFFYYKSEK